MSKKSISSKSETDWKKLDAMTDEEIDFSDCPEITPQQFAKSVVRRGLPVENNKQQTTNTSTTRSLSARPETRRRVAEGQCRQQTTNNKQPTTNNQQLMKIFISTGEVSGDLQGALLISALKRLNNDLEIVALGGDRMAAAGATLLGQTAAIGSVGLVESLPFIWPTFLHQRRAKKYLRENPPDVVVFIDYPALNLSLGSYLRKYLPQVPIVYYIAPQNWVWSPNTSTAKSVVKISDRLLAIFPEEARYFQALGGNVNWVGHPLVDRMATAPTREFARTELGIGKDQLAIALLPASRQQEIQYLLPVICSAAQQLQAKLPNVRFVIPISLPTYRDKIAAMVEEYGLQATLLEGKTKEIIAAADLAISKSGTVNLEIALLKVPQVVLYRVNPATIWIARKVLKFSISFMSPPNLVLMKSIVPELLQEEATPDRIVAESWELLFNQDRREQMLKDYEEMKEGLGEVGVCDRAAKAILELVSSVWD